MARYDRYGGHRTYGRTEPNHGAMTFFGYSTTHSSATTEVVEFKVAPDHHSPTRNELYKDHAVGHKLHPVLAHDHRPEKGSEYSPKVGNQVVHGQTKGSPRSNVYRDNSPPNSPKVGNHVVRGQTKASPWDNVYRDNSPLNSPKVGDHVVRGQTKGSPWDNVYRDNSPLNSPKVGDHVVRGQTKSSPWDNVYRDNSPSNSPIGGNHVVRGQTKGSPWDNGYRGNSPPSRDNYRTTHHYGKNDNDYVSSDDEDVTCRDGVCYKKGGVRQHHIKDEDYYKEKNKGNGYAPPSYTTTQPRKDTYYETSNDRPLANPPPIRTRTHEKRWGPEFPNESTRNSPVSARTTQEPYFNASSPRKTDEGYKETLDRGSPLARENYTRTIDSREAAKKYNGVLVST